MEKKRFALLLSVVVACSFLIGCVITIPWPPPVDPVDPPGPGTTTTTTIPPAPSACSCSKNWTGGTRPPSGTEQEVYLVFGNWDCRALLNDMNGSGWFISKSAYKSGGLVTMTDLGDGTARFHAACGKHPATGEQMHYYGFREERSANPLIEQNDQVVRKRDTFRVYYRTCE